MSTIFPLLFSLAVKRAFAATFQRSRLLKKQNFKRVWFVNVFRTIIIKLCFGFTEQTTDRKGKIANAMGLASHDETRAKLRQLICVCYCVHL